MGSLNQLFWAGQEVYIMMIFLPVIIGSLVLCAGVAALFAISFRWQHYRLWRLGKEEDCFHQTADRLKTLLAVIFANFRLGKEFYPGTMHLLIFWGTLLVFLGKITRLFSYPVGLTNPPHPVFLYASFVSEIGGVLVLIGGCLAVIRRYIIRPSRLETKPDNTLVFIWGAAIFITGYLIKGFRMAAVGVVVPPDWFSWAPVSYLVSRFILVLPTEPLNELLIWHRVLIHAIPALLLFAYVAVSRSPLQHLFLSPLNIFFRSLKPKGALDPITNFEEAETFGVKEISEFTWKQLLDLEACTNCGRCQDVCPAHLSEKPLSPRRMTQNLKQHLWREGPKLLSLPPEQRQPEPIVGTSVSEDELWACTTCMACEEACPVYIEQIRRNIDIRRYQVLMETKFAPEVQLTLKNMENNSNPWGIGSHLRADWAEGLGIKTLAEDPHVEYLFYVGCSGSFDDRGKKVSVAFAKILKAAGVSFGFLGTEEGCCGDSAMRIGNEYLYQNLAQANIEIMKGYNVKKIIATCPHGYNALKKDYPHFDGNFEVWHHTEMIADLIANGRILLKKPVEGLFTYHDSCFLGRYNGIYDQPRRILKAVPGLKLTEMERNLARSFCCGAGGARMWMDEAIGERINNMRTDQAIAAGADRIAVGCPFCLTMLADGIKDRKKEETMAALDIAEIVWKAMDLEEEKPTGEVCAAPSAS
jgi:Fe-S oxidoreductase/nitrate reductase gamma subunit